MSKKFKLSGGFIKINEEVSPNLNAYWGEKLYIKKVIYSAPVTIVLWSDGTKSMSRCAKEDTYNKETGLMICVFKKLYGRERLIDLLTFWALPDKNIIDLTDVRAEQKKALKPQNKIKEEDFE